MSEMLCEYRYARLVELSATRDVGYGWFSVTQLLAAFGVDQGALLCQVELPADRPTIQVSLTAQEMSQLIGAYQAYQRTGGRAPAFSPEWGKVLFEDEYTRLVELSASQRAGYGWMSVTQLLASFAVEGGVALCRVEVPTDRPTYALTLSQDEMDALVREYQVFLQGVEQSRGAAFAADANEDEWSDELPF